MIKLLAILLLIVFNVAFGQASKKPETSYKQLIPAVQFNHAFLVLDSADYNSLKNSDFIKTEFSVFQTKTTKANNDMTWSGSYLFGTTNYLEFFQSNGTTDVSGSAAVALSVDHVGNLLKLDSTLNGKYLTVIDTMAKEIDAKMIPWFYALSITDSIFFLQSHISFWIMEYRREYFDYNNWKYSNDTLSLSDYLSQYNAERKNKILKTFTGITYYTTPKEKEYFNDLLTNCGYKKSNKEDTFISPENYSIHFEKRKNNCKYSIKEIDFETNKSEYETIIISEHIKILLNGKNGEITFN